MTWNVHLADHGDFFVRGRVRILISRDAGDRIVELALQDGSAFVDADQTIPLEDVNGTGRPWGYEIPADALFALRDAIDEKLGRRYDEALVFELRQALERLTNRYDDLVDRIADAAVDRHTTELAIGHLGRVARPSAADVGPILEDSGEPF
jgi:hypothetical protein